MTLEAESGDVNESDGNGQHSSGTSTCDRINRPGRPGPVTSVRYHGSDVLHVRHVRVLLQKTLCDHVCSGFVFA